MRAVAASQHRPRADPSCDHATAPPLQARAADGRQPSENPRAAQQPFRFQTGVLKKSNNKSLLSARDRMVAYRHIRILGERARMHAPGGPQRRKRLIIRFFEQFAAETPGMRAAGRLE